MFLLKETVTADLPGTLSIFLKHKKGLRNSWLLLLFLAPAYSFGHLPLTYLFFKGYFVYEVFWIVLIIILSLAVTIVIKYFHYKKTASRFLALQKKQAIEQERRRIAADIHDDLGAELTGISILSQLLKYRLFSNKEESLKLVEKIQASSNQVLTKMNEVVWALNVKDYTLKNLAAHLRSYVTSLKENTGMDISVLIQDNVLVNYPLKGELTGHVFLVTKELLQNAIKHSKAKHITLQLSLLPLYRLCIEYHDDGIGFDAGLVQPGNGLRNIRRRIANSSGTVDFLPKANGGCHIKIIVPITASTHEHEQTS
jgi:signal transduction histidine kinase